MSVRTYPKVIQVFEHEKLKVGEIRQGVRFEESHWQSLLKLNEKQYPPFFKVIHQGIQLSSFVGILSFPSLTLEILPKADAKADHPGIWRHWLMEMLLACEKISPHALSASPIQLRQHNLLDIWLHQFVKAVEHLLQQGLLKQYQLEESSQSALRGKLLFAKHIRQNLVHQERFYTRYACYDEAHPLHQMIGVALTYVEQLAPNMKLKDQAGYLKSFFPEGASHIVLESLPRLQYNRQTTRYRPVMELAYLILSHLSPTLKAGDQAGLALMFDMNVLYEEYIYRQLHKAAHKRNLCLHKQTTTQFWAKRSLRPDMVLHVPHADPIILDTKWKLLHHGHPPEEDLKQIYIYNHYFKAQRGVLLYPQVSSHPSYRQAYHQPADQKLFCEVHFVNVLDEQQRLNRHVGEEILDQLMVEC